LLLSLPLLLLFVLPHSVKELAFDHFLSLLPPSLSLFFAMIKINEY
jgi:hypothetical protein